MAFSSYSTTPASNTSINGINIAEGCPAANANDALRQLAADGRELYNLVFSAASSPFMAADGTASAPSYSFGADTNTGFYRITTDKIGIATAGTLRGAIDASGHMAWGKSSTGAFGTAGVEMFSNGAISQTVSSDPVHNVNRLGTDGAVIAMYKDTVSVGSITVTAAGTTYNTTSDARLKINVQPLEAGAVIDQLRPVTYTWSHIPGNVSGVGFIAQELYEAIPAAVKVGGSDPHTPDGQWQVSKAELVPYIVAELKAQRSRVAALEARIAALEARL